MDKTRQRERCWQSSSVGTRSNKSVKAHVQMEQIKPHLCEMEVAQRLPILRQGWHVSTPDTTFCHGTVIVPRRLVPCGCGPSTTPHPQSKKDWERPWEGTGRGCSGLKSLPGTCPPRAGHTDSPSQSRLHRCVTVAMTWL